MVLRARQLQDEDEARTAALALGLRAEEAAAGPGLPLRGTAEASQQPAGADAAEDPATPVAPVVKRGRRVDPEGRDAGDDTGMVEASQEKPDETPPGS